MKKASKVAIAAALIGLLVSVTAAQAVTTWSHTNFAATSGRFTATFDLVPASVGRTQTYLGLSHSPASVLTGLATAVRLDTAGKFDVLDRDIYKSARTIIAEANVSYHFREAVDLETHTYSIYVTYLGHREQALAQDYRFGADLDKISSIDHSNEAESVDAVSVRNLTIRDGAVDSVISRRCKFSSFDDGCWGADAGKPNDFSLLDGYRFKPPWDVAGVAYYVGVPVNTLRDPTTAPLPSGCSYASDRVTCSVSDVTISGYNFARHSTQLYFPPGLENANITGNKFALNSRCADPLIDFRGGGTVYIAHNSLEGEGLTCQTLTYGTLVNVDPQDGTKIFVEYNAFINVPTDVVDVNGPSPGRATIIARYNLISGQGYQAIGHPDGIQFYGGNIDTPIVSFNAYYASGNPVPDQPFHVEAQGGTAAAPITITAATVSHNTVLTRGACFNNTYPSNCSANFDIACKADDANSFNVGYAAYDNYLDPSGALAPLDAPISLSGTACTGTSWGRPVENFNMRTGSPLPLAH